MEGRSTVATCPACDAIVAQTEPVCPTCGFDRSGGPQPFERGTVLEGRYRIDDEAGRGGMGVVYRGTDLTLSRPVAIKAMRVSGADAGVLARFMHEARALASVEHRNLVPAYAIGQEAGVYYMVMKFVEGRTLDEVLRVDGPMPELGVRRIVAEVCDALSALHSAGLVHRDMKPGNIMLGDDGRVTVMDLGIVQQIEDDAEGVEAASTVGTPRYMPPEMFSGGEVDGRADIYALGVIAFTALTGRPPFDGPTPMAILYKQAHETPPDLREVAPHVSPGFAAAIHCALAKDPANRFPDAATFARAATAMQAATSKGLGMQAIGALVAVMLLAGGLTAMFVGGGLESEPDAAVVDAQIVDAAIPDVAVDAMVIDAIVDAEVIKVTLEVTSSPSGAAVTIDGERVGKTPLTLQRPQAEGRVRIRLRKRNYVSKSVSARADEDDKVHVKLEEQFELVP